MNIILIIILINIILILSLKYSIYLALFFLIILSVYMIKFYYNIDNVLEGYTNKSNFEEKYRNNFFKLLNKNVKTELDENILFNSIMGNFKELMKLLNVRDDVVPVNQMCKGEFSDWGKCSKTCGRGKKTRRFNELQKAGKTGIKCIYENGQEQSEECFERICNDGENCEDDIDCLSGYCDRDRNICSYRNMCSVSQTQNCNFQECKALNDEFGEYSYNLDKNQCENIRKNGYLVKDAIGVGETRDIFKELNNYIKDYNKFFSKNTMGKLSNVLCNNLDLTKYTDNCNKFNNDSCNGGYEINGDLFNNTAEIIPCFYDNVNQQCLSLSDSKNFVSCSNVLYCNNGLIQKSENILCSAITNYANSAPYYKDTSNENKISGCIVNNIENSPSICGTLQSPCSKGEISIYKSSTSNNQPCRSPSSREK